MDRFKSFVSRAASQISSTELSGAAASDSCLDLVSLQSQVDGWKISCRYEKDRADALQAMCSELETRVSLAESSAVSLDESLRLQSAAVSVVGGTFDDLRAEVCRLEQALAAKEEAQLNLDQEVNSSRPARPVPSFSPLVVSDAAPI